MLEIDPELLRSAGARLSAIADRFDSELRAFQSELGGYGEPWGNDDIGSLIGAAHTEVAAIAFDCYGDARDELGAIGEDLGRMADSHEAADRDNARLFSGLLGNLSA